jgi:hypothetical protein
MIPLHISGSLEQPTATFGVDPARPERVCVSSLAVHEMSDAMMRPVWTISTTGRDCRRVKQAVYGQAPEGFATDVPAQMLKPGVRYTVAGHGWTSWPAAVPWSGGGDFIFQDGEWRPAPPFTPGR